LEIFKGCHGFGRNGVKFGSPTVLAHVAVFFTIDKQYIMEGYEVEYGTTSNKYTNNIFC
jgi:hypothetical protein